MLLQMRKDCNSFTKHQTSDSSKFKAVTNDKLCMACFMNLPLNVQKTPLEK